ncbi:MAG: hypothetical protein ACREIQ_01885 [Nitrospiria bacterium]
MEEQDSKKATQAVRQVFTIVERDGKNFWTRIGAAFTNRDGSETVLLDALPLNGRMQIRTIEGSKRKGAVPENQN